MMCAFLRLSASSAIDDDIRFGWPVLAPGGTAASPYIVDTADIDLAGAAVAEGARAVLVRTADDLDPVDRMAVALGVIEAETGLAPGALAILALASGPGAVLTLVRDATPRPRLAAIGLDEAAFPPQARPESAVTARGLVALAAAARRLPAFLAGPVGPMAGQSEFGHRLAAAEPAETA